MSVAARARRPRAPPILNPTGCVRHRTEATLLYQLVERHYPAFHELRTESGRPLPECVEQEFEAYLKCGRLEEGFLRVRCDACRAEKLVGSRGRSMCCALRAAFGRVSRLSCQSVGCKRRGFCPSCGARRVAETAALLADELLPERPLRQWVLSLTHALRFLLATNPAALTRLLGVVYRTISGFLLRRAGLTRSRGHTGAVTLV